MSSSYTDVLDVGREKLNEGDYLKLASFLQSLHNENDSSRIMRKETDSLQLRVEFETYKNHQYSIYLDKQITTVYTGTRPNLEIIYGTWNGTPFEMSIADLKDKLHRVFHILGAKNIKRTLQDLVPEDYKTMRSFMKVLQERTNENQKEGEEPDDVDDWQNEYIINVLFGLSELI